MHDGSVPTLEDAIDHEVYYRSLQAGRPLNLSVEERLDLAEFLRSL
jgi:cytochrome c peroxidase